MPHLRELVDRLCHTVEYHPELSFRFMEVCGTHTTSVFRHGLDTVFPAGIELVSGPGCPVCVMPTGYIDQAIELTNRPEVLIATFGDLVRVPGSGGRALCHPHRSRDRVRVVYSPIDAVRLARENPDREVVFLSVGFETTVPVAALALEQAEKWSIGNFSLLVGHRLIPPALEWLAQSGNTGIDGFLAPGHVSAVIGVEPYSSLAARYGVPVVIGGFGPEEIIGALLVLVTMRASGVTRVINAYPHAVRPTGNRRALELASRFFEAVETSWRGLGSIPASGLRLRPEYALRDAAVRFGVPFINVSDPPGCSCGGVLKGRLQPAECPLFGTLCRPEHPVGPCMVSSEGTCAAHFRYGKGGSRVVPDHIVAW